MGVARFERFFRAAAGLDVDKDDLERHSDFINQKLYDLLIVGQATARANRRDVIEPQDLPITKGLQESVHAFGEIDQEIELQPILEHLATQRPMEAALGEATQSRLPGIAGGLSIALARTFTIIDPKLQNPQTEHWQRAFRIFDLLL
jgi:hypothetical protein